MLKEVNPRKLNFERTRKSRKFRFGIPECPKELNENAPRLRKLRFGAQNA